MSYFLSLPQSFGPIATIVINCKTPNIADDDMFSRVGNATILDDNKFTTPHKKISIRKFLIQTDLETSIVLISANTPKLRVSLIQRSLKRKIRVQLCGLTMTQLVFFD